MDGVPALVPRHRRSLGAYQPTQRSSPVGGLRFAAASRLAWAQRPRLVLEQLALDPFGPQLDEVATRT